MILLNFYISLRRNIETYDIEKREIQAGKKFENLENFEFPITSVVFFKICKGA